MHEHDGCGVSRRAFLGATAAMATLGAHALAAEPSAPNPVTAATAVEELTKGNARFVKGEILQPRRELERLRSLAGEQKPYAAILGCADSRVPIEILFDEGFGDLFVVRVAGNVATAVEIASLEYGVAVLGVKAVMVLGHDACGAVKAAMAGGAVPGQISTLYQHIVPGIGEAKGDVGAAISANVKYQAQKLRDGSPVIGGAVKDGSVRLLGGVFDFKSGAVKPVEL
jgi:carbonic anhydrase